MAEEVQAAETEGHETEEHGEGGDDKRVPYSRFEEINAARKEAERQAQEFQQRLQELEDRDKSEAERAKARAERAEQELQQLSQTVTNLQKGSWVRSAATELNFHDPEDAFSLLESKLGSFEDERAAKRAVQALAKSKKHLVREEEKKDDRPNLGRMFTGQSAQPQNGQQQQNWSPVQQARQNEVEGAKSLAEELGKFIR